MADDPRTAGNHYRDGAWPGMTPTPPSGREEDTVTVGSLFSGIGGIDRGLTHAGLSCRWQVEKETYERSILEKHWPAVRRYEEIRTLAGHELEPVDLICGGPPCQPVSVAGKRLGDRDERWLWPDFFRLLGVLRPRYALMENPPGIFVRGFDYVLGSLSDIGYDAEWQVISATDVGAPHLRKRVWIVAYTMPSKQRRDTRENKAQTPPMAYAQGERRGETREYSERSEEWTSGGSEISDAHEPGLERRDGQGLRECPGEWIARSSNPSIFGGDAASEFREFTERSRAFWEPEPRICRILDGVPSRVHRLRGLGNSVVPQIVEFIGHRIRSQENGSEIEMNAGYGLTFSDCLAYYDRATRSWKTLQASLFGDSTTYSDRFPTSGMMRNGRLYRRPTLARHTCGKESGLWPTPCLPGNGGTHGKTKLKRLLWPTPRANDAEKRGNIANDPRNGLPAAVKYPTPTSSMMTLADMEQARYAASDPDRPRYSEATQQMSSESLQSEPAPSGSLNPEFVEYLMGYPIGYTALED